MDADGQNVRKITATGAQEDTPRWTPDGRQIVYVSNATGAYQVWIMNADGTEARRLTDGPAFNTQPSVSPDGKTISFASTRDNNWEIYLMDITGANQRNYTRSPLLEQMPVWFPDGKLAFIQEQKTGPQRNAPIARVAVRSDPAGGTPVVISPTGITVSEFAVSREGDLLSIISSGVVRGGSFTSKLILVSATPGGPRTEVPPSTPQEQVFAPAFRR
jgi:Tol biopolymer transport system component